MGDAGSKTKAYEVDEHPFELRHEVKRLNERLDKIADSLEKSEFKDILENYTDPKKGLLPISWLAYPEVWDYRSVPLSFWVYSATFSACSWMYLSLANTLEKLKSILMRTADLHDLVPPAYSPITARTASGGNSYARKN